MRKEFLIDREMSLDEIFMNGHEIRLLDGSIRLVKGKYCIHQTTGLKRYLSEVYDYIRNVKNNNGVIIAKRLNEQSKLLYMSSAFKPFKPQRKKIQVSVSPVKYEKHEVLEKRKRYSNFKRVGKCVPVSINVKDLIVNDKEILKRELITAGANSVRFYESDKGTLVVVEPLHIIESFKKR
ncbi:hypothetical protein [Bacillus sp. Au-Bac7]|uniref:hypothetical protein n=1 Tax=Bacillus sp. Au-Bac7 TaxID=2906458 RepID=UPI001E51A814|nr:hypothetical protein [Bacillus sp. Au-Bac7]MCE4051695.1 hypothetical protein [Bacillus sp. Au-Bac7]